MLNKSGQTGAESLDHEKNAAILEEELSRDRHV
jgi:hypothetical protein